MFNDIINTDGANAYYASDKIGKAFNDDCISFIQELEKCDNDTKINVASLVSNYFIYNNPSKFELLVESIKKSCKANLQLINLLEDTFDKYKVNKQKMSASYQFQRLIDIDVLKGNENISDFSAFSTRVQALIVILRFSGVENDIHDYNSSIPFFDIQDDFWAKDYIVYSCENSLLDGLFGNKFSPYKEIVRNEFLTILLRCMGYYVKDINFSYNLALVAGLQVGNYSNVFVTQGEMISIIYNSLFSKSFLGEPMIDVLSKKGNNKVHLLYDD